MERPQHAFRALLVAVLAVAFTAMLSLAFGAREDARQREALTQGAQVLASTMDPSVISAMWSSPVRREDDPAYLLLKAHLAAQRSSVPGARFAYLMRVQGEHIRFIADSEPVGSVDESRNNDTYDEAPPEVRRVYQDREASVGAPYTDRWGEWLSAFIPIHPAGASRPFILGLDISAAQYRDAIARERAKGRNLGIVLTLAMAALLAARHVFNEAIRSRDPVRLASPTLRWLAPVPILAAGAAITLPVQGEIERAADAALRERFHRHARVHVDALTVAMREVLTATDYVARFVENSEAVRLSEFRAFSTPVFHRPGAVAAVWFPVPEAENSGETLVTPAGQAPLGALFEPTLDPRVEAAITTARDSRLATTSAPLEQDGRSLLIFTARSLHPSHPGFAAVVMDATAALGAAVEHRGGDVAIRVTDLRDPRAPFAERPATVGTTTWADPDLPVHREVVHIGGRQWLVSIAASSSFIEQYAWQAKHLFLWFGLICSALVAAAIRQTAVGQLDAERLVGVRTAELALASERVRLALDGSKMTVWSRPIGGFDWADQISLHGDPRPARVHAADRDAVLQAFVSHTSGDRDTFDAEYRVDDDTGGVRWVRERGRMNAAGAVIGTTTDITERKTAEIALAEAHDRIAEASARNARLAVDAHAANTAKSQFLATMSHEIRTPLNGVIGMASLLADTPLSADQHRMLDTVRDSGEHLLSLIDDILDFSKIEADRVELDPRPFDPHRTFDALAGMLASRAFAKGLELVVDADLLAAIIGDEGRLRQIVTNLVGNAVKFTAEGTVTVRAWTDGTGPNARLHVEVSDTGTGIAPEAMTRLFEPFRQADATVTRRFGGTGLGLAISRRLAQVMNGDIHVTSTIGRGSTFHLDVEVDAPAAEHAPTPLAGVAVRVACRVPALAAYVTRVLRSHGATPGARGLLVTDAPIGGDAPLVRLVPPDASTEPPHAGERRVARPVRAAELIDAVGALSGRSAPVPSPTINRPSEPPTAAGARLLLVEDNAVNQRVATMMLHKLGYQVELAQHGGEALDKLRTGTFAAVLMDCQMPEMDGFAATRAIRAGAAGADDVPVIAMTANAMRGDEALCLEAGMSAYLTKPIQPELLAATLAAWVGRRDTGGRPAPGGHTAGA